MAEQFDMFSERAGGNRPISRDRAKPAKPDQATINSTVALSEDDMVRQLVETGRYRILRKIEPRAVATVIRPEYPLRGIILDTETTGLSARKDEIIEIGAIAFTFDDIGRIGDVTGIYGLPSQPKVAGADFRRKQPLRHEGPSEVARLSLVRRK